MMLYRVARWTMSLYFRARLKIRFEGEGNVPDKGPFVLVLSHQSHLDSLLLHTFCPRLMFTLAKSSVFRTRFMAWLAPRVGAIPTRRYQIDPQAVRVALRLIERGEGVGVFPEGERSWDGRLQPLRSGTRRTQRGEIIKMWPFRARQRAHTKTAPRAQGPKSRLIPTLLPTGAGGFEPPTSWLTARRSAS